MGRRMVYTGAPTIMSSSARRGRTAAKPVRVKQMLNKGKRK